MTNIVVTGRINDEQKIEANLSSIFSRLIQECGRWTEDYNSDILYDFNTINRLLDYRNWKGYKHHEFRDDGEYCKYVFGFRKLGVDGPDFVSVRGRDSAEYRAMWELEIKKFKKPEYYWETVQFTLTRVF